MLIWAASHQLAAIRFISLFVLICSVQFSPFSGVHLFATPWIAACQASQHHQLSELTQAHVHRLGDAIQPSHSVFHFSFCLQAFLTSGYFPMSQVFLSGGQIIGASASASVFPVNIQDWFYFIFFLGWTALISLQSKGLSSSSTP